MLVPVSAKHCPLAIRCSLVALVRCSPLAAEKKPGNWKMEVEHGGALYPFLKTKLCCVLPFRWD